MIPTELELPPSLRWSNGTTGGTIANLRHLTGLIGLVGVSARWPFLIVERLSANNQEPSRYAQARGHAFVGLAVEVGYGDASHLVAPRGAAHRPRVQIGTYGWHYLAHPGELHSPEAALGIFLNWLGNGALDEDRELRAVSGRGAERVRAEDDQLD